MYLSAADHKPNQQKGLKLTNLNHGFTSITRQDPEKAPWKWWKITLLAEAKSLTNLSHGFTNACSWPCQNWGFPGFWSPSFGPNFTTFSDLSSISASSLQPWSASQVLAKQKNISNKTMWFCCQNLHFSAVNKLNGSHVGLELICRILWISSLYCDVWCYHLFPSNGDNPNTILF